MERILIILLGIFFCLTSNGQEINSQLDNFLDQEISKLNIPNLEVLIVKEDSIIYSKSTGNSTSSSTYYIGSVSKSLTAFGVLKLIENEKLTLKTKIKKVLPEIEFKNSGNELTIWHLLTHTSGIKKMDGFGDLPTLTQLQNSKPNYKISNNNIEPLKHEYSNLNYSLLGLIIEKVAKVSFKEYVEKEIFGPLNMEHSLLGKREEVTPDLINHYQYFGPFPVKAQQLDFSTTSIPAGFICSSANDLANYLKLNLSNGRFNQKQLIDSSLLQTMHTVWDKSDYGYGMGWKQGQYNGFKFYQHLGSTANSYSGIFFIPKKRIGFVFLSNTNSLNFSENLMEGILNILTDGNPQELSRSEWYQRIAVLVAYLFLLFNFIFKIFGILKPNYSVDKKQVLKDILIYSSLLVALIVVFPRVAQIPFLSFLKIQPDIGFLILLSVVLPILLGLVKIIK